MIGKWLQTFSFRLLNSPVLMQKHSSLCLNSNWERTLELWVKLHVYASVRLCTCTFIYIHIYPSFRSYPHCYHPHCSYTGSWPLPCFSKLSCPNITVALNQEKLFKTCNEAMPQTLKKKKKKSNITQGYPQKEVNMLGEDKNRYRQTWIPILPLAFLQTNQPVIYNW